VTKNERGPSFAAEQRIPDRRKCRRLRNQQLIVSPTELTSSLSQLYSSSCILINQFLLLKMKFAIVSILLYVFAENHLSVSARSLRKLSKGSKVKNYNYEANPVSVSARSPRKLSKGSKAKNYNYEINLDSTQHINRAADDNTSSDDADEVEYPKLMFGENSDELLADCRGDCDSDDECETGLICVQRSAYEEMPGCAGEPSWNTDYCLNPARNFKELAYWGQDGPYGRCAGDCGECIYLFCVDWIGRSRKYSLAFVWVALDCIHIFLLDLFALLFHSDTSSLF